MRAISANDLRNNFILYCDRAAAGDTFIIHRPGNRNVVLLSEDEYNDLLKAWKLGGGSDPIDQEILDMLQAKGHFDKKM